MIHINLNMIFYTHVEHSPTKTIYIKQGMTIRTARLPGAGNLLGRAGEDLSGLPDRESRYQFFY